MIFSHAFLLLFSGLVVVAGATVTEHRVLESQQQQQPEQQRAGAGEEESVSSEDILNDCRRHPLWWKQENGTEGCSKATHYDPLQHDLFRGSTWEFPWDDLSWAHQLSGCLAELEETRQQQRAAAPTNDTTMTPPSPPEMSVLKFVPDKHDAQAVLIENAFIQEEADTLKDLATCIRKYHGPSLLEHRPFAYGRDGQEYKGGNDCTFVGTFMQYLTPGVAAQVYRLAEYAWENARWGDRHAYPNPRTFGIRNSGHLSYNGWDELGPHTDSGGSALTVLVFLSDPSDYQGGELYVHPSNRPHSDEYKVLLKPPKHAALVFLSSEEHGVQEIFGGTRETFGTEFWDRGDTPFGILRPSPEMWDDFQRTGDWFYSFPDYEDDGDENEYDDDNKEHEL